MRRNGWTAVRAEWLAVAVFAWFLSMAMSTTARAQIPGLPGVTGTPGPAKDAETKNSDPTEGPVAAPTKENPSATVAAASGPIEINERVSDFDIKRTLESLLPRYPGVAWVDVAVDNGVVTLDGQVADDKVHENVTQFVRRVEGVRLILNSMKTDDELLTAPQLAMRELNRFGAFFTRKWLLMLLAIGVVAVAAILARGFHDYSETLLAPFLRNVLLRSVAGSTIAAMLMIGGLLLALSILDLTRAVLSILGLAGVVGLAVGFAFKDITENFIASVLLGLRRPFRLGDLVQVAGQLGVVKSLNTRATVLATLDGNHVRIPNSVIFKEILVNRSAANSVRSSFELLIPHEASTAAALEVVTQALRSQDGILPDPSPRALVQDLEPGGVRLRTYYWLPVKGIDGDKLQSDLKLKVKVALQEAGIRPPTRIVSLALLGQIPVRMIQAADSAPVKVAAPAPVLSAVQARANLRRDRQAAAGAETPVDDGRATPIEHALEQPETHVSDEGANLLDQGDESKRNGNS